MRINKFLAGVTLACTLMLGTIGFLGSDTVQAANVASATQRPHYLHQARLIMGRTLQLMSVFKV
ncbi:hypothetical protein [Paenibacillus macquariensis]|uniref:Uncharacterized protein n=1 Tax=Paenibacillus macquariensis TaxID=948756 RepID=A0ABY1JJC6_9BACL|nr:hypothetical protein [Paenibacillus macquariensis]MEC0089697.1 hypothetical protein [Paenibacillus macquariensis]OAB30824.1 hypothetical protein PMSM_22060 [Paenibacillus macquariensis subsp. macquariensis]SIQ29033.1 hypothetical protein SAMN05421578_10170 [Paenibacillus macquariensis]